MLQRDRVLKKSAGCEKNSLSEKFLFWKSCSLEKKTFPWRGQLFSGGKRPRVVIACGIVSPK